MIGLFMTILFFFSIPISSFANTEVDLGVVSLECVDEVSVGETLEIIGYVKNYALDIYNGSIPLNIKVEDYLPQNIESLTIGQYSMTLENVSIDSNDSLAFSIEIDVDDTNFTINTTDILIIWPAADDDTDVSNDYAYKAVFIDGDEDNDDESEDENSGGSSDGGDSGGSSDDEEEGGSSDSEDNGGSSDDDGGSSDDDEDESSMDEDSETEQSFVQDQVNQNIHFRDGECFISLEKFQEKFALLSLDQIETISILIFDTEARLRLYEFGPSILSLDISSLEGGLYKVLIHDNLSSSKDSFTVTHLLLY